MRVLNSCEKKKSERDIFRSFPSNLCKQKKPAGKPTRKGGAKVTKEQLGNLILDSERQMYSTAKSILYSDQDCADAIQETILTCWEKIDTLQKNRYFKTWMVRILINKCKDILRSVRRVVCV